MNPEEYRRVGELYHAALERPTNERKGFLDGACGGDADIAPRGGLPAARARAGWRFHRLTGG